jgi:hypothetical protein
MRHRAREMLVSQRTQLLNGFAWFASERTPTNRIEGRVTASQIAAAGIVGAGNPGRFAPTSWWR